MWRNRQVENLIFFCFSILLFFNILTLVLCFGNFRSVNDTKMMVFFKNDFSEDRWRRAALKNAFALLGRQRFEHAAAFFLLAGAIRDAIEVIKSHLCNGLEKNEL